MLFNQQQCFIYSTASFLSKLRAKKVEKLHNSSFYRNFRILNTGIRFRNREWLFPVLSIIKKKIKKKIIIPTDPRFFWHVTVNTHIFFFGLTSLQFKIIRQISHHCKTFFKYMWSTNREQTHHKTIETFEFALNHHIFIYSISCVMVFVFSLSEVYIVGSSPDLVKLKITKLVFAVSLLSTQK